MLLNSTVFHANAVNSWFGKRARYNMHGKLGKPFKQLMYLMLRVACFT